MEMTNALVMERRNGDEGETSSSQTSKENDGFSYGITKTTPEELEILSKMPNKKGISIEAY